MSQKTENFKTTQIPLWEDGDLANGANFEQLITAIATLVDEERQDILDAATAGKLSDEQVKSIVRTLLNDSDADNLGAIQKLKQAIEDAKYTDDKAKAVAKALLDTASDYQSTQAYIELKGLIDGKEVYTDEKAKTATKEVLNTSSDYEVTELYKTLKALIDKAPKVVTYTFDDRGNIDTLVNGVSDVSGNIPEKYRKFLTVTTTPLPAEQIGNDYVLTRADGARIVYTQDTGGQPILKPAPALIG